MNPRVTLENIRQNKPKPANCLVPTILPTSDMKLQITYDPKIDTLYIGNGQPATKSHDVAENFTAYADFPVG